MHSSVSERVLPQAVEAEASVLGAMLRSPDTIAIMATSLKASHFYGSVHRVIFEAINELWAVNHAVDLVLLHDHLERRGLLEKCGGASYLASLEESGSPAHAELYAAMIRDRAFLRSLAGACAEVTDTLCENPKPAAEIRTWAEKRMFDVFADAEITGPVEISGPLTEAMNLVEAIHEGRQTMAGVSSPWKDLDVLTCGWQPSTLYVIAGRPSMGKTSFAMNAVEDAASRQKVPCLVFSLETSAAILSMNMICSNARVDSHLVRKGLLNERLIQKMTDSTGYLYNAPILIDDTPGISIWDIRARARLAKMRKNIGMVVIDYLQLVSCEKETQSENREQTVARISKNCKEMARELKIPVLVMAQLNRMPDGRKDHRPLLADLRESGAIEQDADCVIFLHREGYYKARAGGEDSPETEVSIAKQRNGPIGTVITMFQKEYLRFEMASNRADPDNVGDY